MATEQAAPATTAFEAAFKQALKTDMANPETDLLPKEPNADAPPPAEKPPESKKDAPKKEEAKSKIPDSLFQEPPAEKKEEPTPVKSELDDIAAPKDEKAKGNFEALRTKAKEYETNYKKLSQEFEDFKKNSNTDELKKHAEELEKQNQEYSDLVSRARVEMHPEFRKTFIEGRNTLMEKAKQIFSETGNDVSEIETALNLQGKARVEALAAASEKMDSFSSGRLGRVIDELTDLDTKAAQKIKDSNNSWQEIQANDAKAAEAKQKEFSKTVRESFDAAKSKLVSTLEVLQEVEGYPEWNERKSKILKDAQTAWETNSSIENAAQAMILSKAVPVYRELFLEQRKESKAHKDRADEAEKKLASIYSRSPNIGGGKGGGGTQKPQSFVDHFVSAQQEGA